MRRRRFLAGCCALPLVAVHADRFALVPAVDRGAAYLIKQQRADGSWISDIYGVFSDGRGLTPLITLALLEHGTLASKAAAAKARRWLWAHTDTLTDVFPVHNASWLLQAGLVDPAFHRFRKPFVERLRSLQMRGSSVGGWGYAPLPPPPDRELAPFQQATLAATALAITGLKSSGVPPSDPAMREALGFVQQCQNLTDPERSPRSKFDDGGFFQMPGDPTRNKAGRAGHDADGRARMHSYTSATADGLRALLLCGQSRSDTRPRAATQWLNERATLTDVPDLRHFTALALASVVLQLPAESKLTKRLCGLCQALDRLQQGDGSWRNHAGEMREDDPLVATAMTVLALARLGNL